MSLCPKCNRNDRVIKVSSIYSGGISSGTYSGPTTGMNIPIGEGQTSVTGGYATLSGSSQTLLSKKLAPPRKPSTPGVSWLTVLATMILVGIGMIFCFLSIFYNTLASLVGLSGYVPFLFLCIAPSIISIVLAIVIISSAIIIEKNRAKAVASQIPHWQKAIARWNRLYYCERDDGVFDPDEKTFVPTEHMMSYIYR